VRAGGVRDVLAASIAADEAAGFDRGVMRSLPSSLHIRDPSIYIRQRIDPSFWIRLLIPPFNGSGKHGEAHLGKGGVSEVYRRCALYLLMIPAYVLSF